MGDSPKQKNRKAKQERDAKDEKQGKVDAPASEKAALTSSGRE